MEEEGKRVALRTSQLGGCSFPLPLTERWAAVLVTWRGAHRACSGNMVQMRNAFVFPERARLQEELIHLSLKREGQFWWLCAVFKREVAPVSSVTWVVREVAPRVLL